MARQSWCEWTSYVESNKFYCSIIFANRNASTTFIKFIYKVNQMSKWDPRQTHHYKKGSLTPHSRQTHTLPDLNTGAITARLLFLLPQSPRSEFGLNFCRIAHAAHPYIKAWRTLAIISPLMTSAAGTHRSLQKKCNNVWKLIMVKQIKILN
jgi:hypothetical protein